MAPIEVPIKLTTTGGEQSAREILKLNDAVSKVDRSIDRFEQSGGIGALVAGAENIDVARQKLGLLAFQAENVLSRIVELETEFNDVNRRRPLKDIEEDARNARLGVAELTAEITKIPLDLREDVVNQRVGFLGDLDTGIQTFATSISTGGTLFGGSAIGKDLTKLGAGVGLSGDAFAIAEQIPRLSAGFATLKDRTLNYLELAGKQAQATTGLASAAASSVAPLGSTASGIAAMTVAAAPFLLVGASAAAAFVLVKESLEDGAKAANASIKAEKERIEALRETRESLKSLTLEDAQSQAQELQVRVSEETAARDKLVEDLKNLYNEGSYLEILNLVNNSDVDTAPLVDALAGFSDVVVSDAASGLQKTSGEIKKYNESISEQESELTRLNTQIIPILRQRARAEEDYKIALERGTSDAQRNIDALRQRFDLEIQFNEDLKNLSSEAARSKLTDTENQLNKDKQLFSELERAIAANTDTILDLQEAGVSPEIVEELAVQNRAYEEELNRLFPAIQQNEEAARRLKNELIPTAEAHELLTATIEKEQATLDALRTNLQSTENQLQSFLSSESATAARKKEEAALKATRSEEESLLKTRYDGLIAARDNAKAQERLKGVEQERISKITEINIKFFNDSLKRTQEFYLKEKRSQEDANLQRLRMVEDLQADLFEASAANDVNSFVNRLRSGSRDISRFDQDTSIESRRRGEDFALSNSDAIAAREREIQAVRETSEAKLQAERDSQAKSLSLEQQYQAELTNLKQNWQQADIARQEELQRQAAQQRYNALITDLQNTNRALIEGQRAMAQNAAIAGQNTGVGFLNGFISTINGAATSRGGAASPAIASPARLGRPALMSSDGGGLSIPFMQSSPTAAGRGGVNITVTGNNFGQVASPADLAAMKTEISNAVVNGISMGFGG